MFEIGDTYSKNDIYGILNVPIKNRKGSWDTGYRTWDSKIYIFANIGIPGRDGSNYDNYWDGDELVWYAKSNATEKSAQVKKLTSPGIDKLLFTRTNNQRPFTFQGDVEARSVNYASPICIVWFIKSSGPKVSWRPPEEIIHPLKEGTYKKIIVNKYERNPDARRMCIEHYGSKCQVCNFDFSIYGEMGSGYIHVHHLVLISSIGKEYVIDPIADLIPVCANCHAMIHLKNPPITIEDLRSQMKQFGNF